MTYNEIVILILDVSKHHTVYNHFYAFISIYIVASEAAGTYEK